MNMDFMDSGAVLSKTLEGKKPFPEEAVHLCREGALLEMALAAREMDRQLHPQGSVGYAVSKTIVYSNVCQPDCPFCIGTVNKDDSRAFTKTAESVASEAADAVAAGATQIVLQGGHRTDLPWEYYTGLIQALRNRFPEIQIFGYSPTEVMVFHTAFGKRTADIIDELQAAGMDGFLAGGAQTMTTRIPEYKRLLQGPWNPWFDVVHRCVDAEIPMVVPFVFGLGESEQQRVGHLYRVRAVQERTFANKKLAFRALSVFTLPVEEVRPVTGHEYLRMVALARLLVPNIDHIQSSFVAQGAKVAQVALGGGADDLGGTHMEFDQVELAAGRVGPMSAAEMERLIRDAGRTPVRRKRW